MIEIGANIKEVIEYMLVCATVLACVWMFTRRGQ